MIGRRNGVAAASEKNGSDAVNSVDAANEVMKEKRGSHYHPPHHHGEKTSFYDDNGAKNSSLNLEELDVEKDENDALISGKESGDAVESTVTGAAAAEQPTSQLLKWGVLLLLVLQTSGHALLLKYSRVYKLEASERRFIPSSAILVTELLKLLLSGLAYFLFSWFSKNKAVLDGPMRHLTDELLSNNMRLLMLPGFLFLVQTQLIYFGIARVPLTAFQVLQLLKILTTAVFSVIMLGTKLSKVCLFVC